MFHNPAIQAVSPAQLARLTRRPEFWHDDDERRPTMDTTDDRDRLAHAQAMRQRATPDPRDPEPWAALDAGFAPIPDWTRDPELPDAERPAPHDSFPDLALAAELRAIQRRLNWAVSSCTGKLDQEERYEFAQAQMQLGTLISAVRTKEGLV